MIYIVIGTRAQLVKMAPVIKRIELLNWPMTLLYTGQHKESMDDLCRDFQIKSLWHPLYLHTQEIKTIFHALKWLTKLGLAIIINPGKLLPGAKTTVDDVVLVHGDTLSTLLGALLGKRLNIKVGHVEAGLRSYNFFNPFPEEIVRHITAYLSDIAFCPSDWAVNNLKNHGKLLKVNTGKNTIADSLSIALDAPHNHVERLIPVETYCVVSIHRFENIFFTKTLKQIVEQLIYVANRYKLIFVLHPATEKRLTATGLINELNHHGNIELRKRTGYFDFVRLLSTARFVITDGGSNQEELSLLNIPTLLMRKATERQEGLGENVCLGGLSYKRLEQFLLDLDNAPQVAVPKILNTKSSPSARICEAIAFAARA